MIRNVRTFLVEKVFYQSVAQRPYSEEKSKERSEFSPLVITISRQHGCYGAETALALQKLLGSGWIVFHREILEAIAKDSDIEKEYLASFDEKTIPWIEQIVRGFYRPYMNDSAYLNYLKKFLVPLAKIGKVIVIGRGANFILKNGFHVRLVGPISARIKNLMENNKYTSSQAASEIEEADKQRFKFIKNMFGADVDDPLNYDLVVNTKDLNFQEVAKLLYEATKLAKIFQ